MTKVRAVLRRRWPLLAVTALLGVVAGISSVLVSSGAEVDRYEVEQVLVANDVDGHQPNVPQDALRLTRGEVSDLAAKALGQPGRRQELSDRVQVSAEPDSNSITVKVVDADPQFASDVVQAFSSSFLRVVNSELRSDDVRRREQLAQRVEVAKRELEAFDQEFGFIARTDVPPPATPTIDALAAERRRLTDAQTAAEHALQNFELELSQREPYMTLGPESPRFVDQLVSIPRSVPIRVGLLGTLGLLLGIALVILVERVARRIDTREELASVLNVPIIAEIAHIYDDKLPRSESGAISLEGVWSEHYRRVRSAIQFVKSDARPRRSTSSTGVVEASSSPQHPGAFIPRHVAGSVPRVFLFVSSMPGEGKSTSTVLTGMALAETGDQTVIINADFRRPSIERYLGIEASPGLAELAALTPHRPSVDEVVQMTGVPNLWAAAAGPPTLEVEARLQAAREVASEAARRGGTVLIDSSPLGVTNDSIDLLPVVDEVILVVRAGQSTVKSLEQTLATLDMHHAPVLGAILIGTASTQEMYSYYDSYFDDAVKVGGGRRRGRLRPTFAVRGRRGLASASSAPRPLAHGPHGQVSASTDGQSGQMAGHGPLDGDVSPQDADNVSPPVVNGHPTPPPFNSTQQDDAYAAPHRAASPPPFREPARAEDDASPFARRPR